MHGISNLKKSWIKIFGKRFYSNLHLWNDVRKHTSKVVLSDSVMEFSSGQFAKMTSGSAIITYNENAVFYHYNF